MIYFFYWFIVVVTCIGWGVQLVQMSVVKDTAHKIGFFIGIVLAILIRLPFFIMIYPVLQYVN